MEVMNIVTSFHVGTRWDGGDGVSKGDRFLQSLNNLRTGQRWSKAVWILAVTSPRCVQVESQKGWGHVLRRLSWSSPSNALEQPLRRASWFLLDFLFPFLCLKNGVTGCSVAVRFAIIF